MKEESNPKPSPPTSGSGSGNSSLLERGAAVAIVGGSQIAVFPGASGLTALQRPPRTISCTSYDSESDDCMQRSGPSSVATTTATEPGEKLDASASAGNNSASK